MLLYVTVPVAGLLLLCLVCESAAGGCTRYGHACWGGHGKRSGPGALPGPAVSSLPLPLALPMPRLARPAPAPGPGPGGFDRAQLTQPPEDGDEQPQDAEQDNRVRANFLAQLSQQQDADDETDQRVGMSKAGSSEVFSRQSQNDMQELASQDIPSFNLKRDNRVHASSHKRGADEENEVQVFIIPRDAISQDMPGLNIFKILARTPQTSN